MKTNIKNKIIGVLKLEPKTYKLLETDKNNFKTSFLLIILISLATSFIYKSYFFNELEIKIPVFFWLVYGSLLIGIFWQI